MVEEDEERKDGIMMGDVVSGEGELKWGDG